MDGLETVAMGRRREAELEVAEVRLLRFSCEENGRDQEEGQHRLEGSETNLERPDRNGLDRERTCFNRGRTLEIYRWEDAGNGAARQRLKKRFVNGVREEM